MRRTTPDILGDVLAAEPGENRLEIRRQLRWDYGQVSAVHRKTVEDAAIDVAIAGRRMAASTMQVGEALRRVKGLLDHGQFSDWCEIEFGMSVRTAQRMMSVAENLGDKSDKLSHLGSSVLYLLGADSTPEAVREAVIEEAAQTGKAPAVVEVRKAIRLYVENLRGIVRLWVEEQWLRNGREIPQNPAHTNGVFWQELTGWMHANISDTWTEADLKAAIRYECRFERPQPTQATAAETGREGERETESQLRIVEGEQLDAAVRQVVMDRYMKPLNQGEADWIAADMRNAATYKNSKVWKDFAKIANTADAIAEAVMRLSSEVEIGFKAWRSPQPVAPAAETAPALDLVVDGGPLPGWVDGAADVAQPAAVVEERQADGDDRLSRLKRWWVRLMAMQNDLLDWGDLTGRHLATGEVERGLRKMLGITQRELDLLEGREVEGEEYDL